LPPSIVRPVLGAGLLACLLTFGTFLLPAPSMADEPSEACTVEVDQTISPEVILLGETTDLRLVMRPSCGQSTGRPLHVVLVIDTSASMQGQPIIQARAAARDFIDDLDLAAHPDTQVGIVSFNNSAKTVCALTNQSGKLKGCLNSLGNAPTGGTDIAAGLSRAAELLQRGRRQTSSRPLTAVLLMSDGTNQAGCNPVETEAGKLKRDGALLGTVCIGEDCDRSCLRRIASQPRFALVVPDPSQLATGLALLRRDLVDVVLEDATITQLLPPDMVVVKVGAPGEPDPSGNIDPQDGPSLRWKVPFVSRDGLTLTYRVRPTRLGEQASGTRAWAVLRRSDGSGLTVDYPQRRILVLQAPVDQPTAAPSPTATLVPPTSAATALPLPSSTPLVAATARVTRSLYRAFLPRVQQPLLIDPDTGLLQPSLFPYRDRP
jgi:uncharacterized protein YegL